MYFSLAKLSKGKPFFLPVFFLLIISSASFAASPPEQPSSGPGGADYSHEAVVSHTYHNAKILGYCIFEPDNPKPSTAPVILFIPGHLQYIDKPNFYDIWVNHLVRKGNIVIFPLHRLTAFLALSFYIEQIARTTHAAIEELRTGDHVRPDLDKFAIVGHSSGGLFAPKVAAAAKKNNLPSPKALMSIACPHGSLLHFWKSIQVDEILIDIVTTSEDTLALTAESDRDWKLVPVEGILTDIATIPEDTLVLTVVGDLDRLANDGGEKAIFNALTQIPLENKDFVMVVSDYYGSPPLVADHLAACSKPSDNDQSHFGVSALDYYGYFKLFDGLSDAAFFGRNREYALGNTPQQRYMGKWSDGTPVKELIVTDNP